MKPLPVRTNHVSGFSLIELTVALVIAGILATVALRSIGTISQTGKVEETKAELEELAHAIAGNPALENNGTRSDFGYVGDVGALPPNLTALFANPGGYATWNGPYVANSFDQQSADYSTDPWGAAYSLTSTSVSSTGNGSPITRRFAASSSELLLNSLSGTITDLDGTPPGAIYDDSLIVRATIPNGVGGTVTRTASIDPGGFFRFDSLPIGVHDLFAVYLPSIDTLTRKLPVTPGSNGSVSLRFRNNYWIETVGGGGGGGSTSGLELVAGSDTVFSPSSCNNIKFSIKNVSGGSLNITSFTLTWTGTTAYYAQAYWDGSQVFNLGGAPRGVSGTTYTFSSSKTIANNATVQFRVEDFTAQNNPGGGADRTMTGTTFTVTFSDGSSFTELFQLCGS